MSDSPEKPKILVIDDEAGPRESLRMVLKKEYEVLLATHVDEGLECCQRENPDAVIMDIRMPGKSGIEGLQELRAVDRQVAVIMLTGFGSLETAQEAIRHGANDYLKKPFDIHEIEETVRRNVQRTQVERRKAKALDELHQLNMSLHEQVALKEQWAVVGEASREFAHDLRNPLTIILGYCELLSDQLKQLHESGNTPAGYETLDYMRTIEENVQRCHELAEQWQKSDKRVHQGLDTVALDELLRDTVKSMEPLAVLGNELVQYEVQAAPVRVQANRLQLLRAIYNILNNALHALPSHGGRIVLRCAVVDGQAVVSIEDNGDGIPAEVLERVFDQGFTTKTPDKGTGLGLYITRKIIQEHGGDVRMESEVGRGTRVRVYLPLAGETR